MAVEVIQRLAVEIGANIKAFTQKMARVVKTTKAAGGGFGKLGARLKGVTSAIRQTAGRFRKAVFSMKGAILGLVTGLVLKKVKDFISTVVNLGDQMAKTAKKIGVGVETLSGLKFVADLAGTSFEAVTGGFRRLSSAAFDANTGLAESKRAFEALDIQVTDSEGNLRDLEDLFFDAADGLAALSSDTERAALAQDLFGRAGLDLIPLLKQGSKEIRKQIQLAKELGITFSVRDAKAAEEFKDQLTILRAALFGLASGIVKQVVPAFTEFFKILTKGFRDVSKEGKDFTTGLSDFIRGLLLTTLASVELMKTIWNGLKLIWLGLQAAFFGLLSIFVGGFILILSKLRNFIEGFQKGFNSLLNTVLGGFKTFATTIITTFTTLASRLLAQVGSTIAKMGNLLRKVPKFEGLAAEFAALGSAASKASIGVEKMGAEAKGAINAIKGFTTSTIVFEKLNKTIGTLGNTNDELRVKLQAINEELKKVAASEAIPFYERMIEVVTDANAAMNANALAAATAAEANTAAADQTKTKLTEVQQTAKEVFASLTKVSKGFLNLLGSSISQFASGVGNAVSRALLFGENFAKSITQVFRELAAAIIAQLVQIIITALLARAALAFFGVPAIDVESTGAQLASSVISTVGRIAGAGSPAPTLAHGGIVTRPTMALIGEAGPEAVIPLDRGGMGGMQTVQIFLDGDMIAETVVERMPEVLRVNAGLEL